MEVSETIKQRVERLPETLQAEVLDFVEYLLSKAERASEDEAWSTLSLASAMRGMEDEAGPTYDEHDLKETFR